MNKEFLIRDHIGVFKNFMFNEMIENYVNYFNKCEQQGVIEKEDETLVSDNSIDVIRSTNVAMTYNNGTFIDLFLKKYIFYMFKNILI